MYFLIFPHIFSIARLPAVSRVALGPVRWARSPPARFWILDSRFAALVVALCRAHRRARPRTSAARERGRAPTPSRERRARGARRRRSKATRRHEARAVFAETLQRKRDDRAQERHHGARDDHGCVHDDDDGARRARTTREDEREKRECETRETRRRSGRGEKTRRETRRERDETQGERRERRLTSAKITASRAIDRRGREHEHAPEAGEAHAQG